MNFYSSSQNHSSHSGGGKSVLHAASCFQLLLQLESQNQELGFDQLDFCYKKSYFISPLKFGDALFLSVDFQVISVPRKGEFFPKLFLLGKNSQYSTVQLQYNRVLAAFQKCYHSFSACFFFCDGL